jgi:hypothetical protein
MTPTQGHAADADRDRNIRDLRAPTRVGSTSTDAWTVGGFAMNDAQKKRKGWSWWYLLFVIQFAVVLWPPLYNTVEPTLLGIPFFYWFQLLWVIVSAVFTAVVYFVTSD